MTAMVEEKVRRTLVVGLGYEGELAVKTLRERLAERFEQMPLIGALVITDQPQPPVTAEIAAPLAGGIRRVVATADDIRLDELRKVANVDAWLPAGQHPDPATRTYGRLALFARINEVRQALHDLLAEITDARHQSWLTSRQIGVTDSRDLDVVLVGSLANPFASGMFTDLAYLLHQVARQDRPPDDLSFMNACLLLPGFRNGEAAGPDDPAARQAARTLAEANGYAALKELDYYLSGHTYHCEYRRPKQPDSFAVQERSTTMHPFLQGAVYLVGATNQDNLSLVDVRDAAAMTGDWLMAMLASPLQADFRARVNGPASHSDRVAVYGSFGLAAIALPLAEVKSYCARRLSYDISHQCLTYAPAPDPAAAQRFRALLKLTQEDLRSRLQENHNWSPEVRKYELRPIEFGGISPWRWLDLERRLQKAQDYRQRTLLPLLQEGLYKNLHALRKAIPDEVIGGVEDELDRGPNGAVRRVGALLQQFHHELGAEQARLEDEHAQADANLKTLAGKIVEARGRYFGAAQVFGKPPFWPVLTTAILLAFLFGMTWRILGQMLNRPHEALAVIALGTLFSLAITIVTERELHHAREVFIHLYAERVKSYRDQAELEPLLELYGQLSGILTDLQDEIAEFRGRIDQLDTLTGEDYLPPSKWAARLCGTPRHTLEESILTPDELERLYIETAPADLQATLDEILRQFGPFHTWQHSTVEELREHLHEYGLHRAAILDDRRVLDYLEPLPDAEWRTRYARLRARSSPFWQCDLSGLDPKPPETRRLIGFDAPSAASHDLVGAIRAVDSQVSILETSDHYRVTSVALQTAFPLFAVNLMRRMEQSYESRRSGKDLGSLHVTRGSMALPNIMPGVLAPPLIETLTGARLEPRLVFALADALGVLAKGPEGYGFRYVTEIDQLLTESHVPEDTFRARPRWAAPRSKLAKRSTAARNTWGC